MSPRASIVENYRMRSIIRKDAADPYSLAYAKTRLDKKCGKSYIPDDAECENGKSGQANGIKGALGKKVTIGGQTHSVGTRLAAGLGVGGASLATYAVGKNILKREQAKKAQKKLSEMKKKANQETGIPKPPH